MRSGTQVIAINLSAAFHAMKAAIPGMKAAGWGRIINIASAHGLVGSAEKSAYVAAKHGIVGLTKVGAIELANAGTTVNAICPGWVLTGAGAGADRCARAIRGRRRRRDRASDADRKAGRWRSSPPRRGSAGWPCSCARRRPAPSPARRCPSTGAGWRSDGRRHGRGGVRRRPRGPGAAGPRGQRARARQPERVLRRAPEGGPGWPGWSASPASASAGLTWPTRRRCSTYSRACRRRPESSISRRRPACATRWSTLTPTCRPT